MGRRRRRGRTKEGARRVGRRGQSRSPAQGQAGRQHRHFLPAAPRLRKNRPNPGRSGCPRGRHSLPGTHRTDGRSRRRCTPDHLSPRPQPAARSPPPAARRQAMQQAHLANCTSLDPTRPHSSKSSPSRSAHQPPARCIGPVPGPGTLSLGDGATAGRLPGPLYIERARERHRRQPGRWAAEQNASQTRGSPSVESQARGRARSGV